MTAWPSGAPRPGDRAELSRRVEAADIRRFTDISGDRNPLHYAEVPPVWDAAGRLPAVI